MSISNGARSNPGSASRLHLRTSRIAGENRLKVSERSAKGHVAHPQARSAAPSPGTDPATASMKSGRSVYRRCFIIVLRSYHLTLFTIRTFVHLEGRPSEIGFQYGSLLAREIEEVRNSFFGGGAPPGSSGVCPGKGIPEGCTGKTVDGVQRREGVGTRARDGFFVRITRYYTRA